MLRLPTLIGLLLAALWLPMSAQAERFIVAAASDLRYALDDIAALYREQHPDQRFDIIYGSSGKMTTQIINGAPYDLFFSADIAFAQQLHQAGLSVTEPAMYAVGRVVIWSSTLDASAVTLEDLATDPRIRRLAIAQPAHAPYGQRAREALESAGVWEQVQGKLVFAENIAHSAQMVQSGAASAGIIALSLAMAPALSQHPYHLIDEALHQPLIQSYVITQHGAGKEAVAGFARFMVSPEARKIMNAYGFVLPDQE